MTYLYRNAQGLALGLPRATGAAAFSLTGTLQQAALLQDLVLNADQLGLVTDIRVAGQSIMVSNQGADISMFAAAAQSEDHRGFGIALDSQQEVSVQGTLAAAGTVYGGLALDPVDPSQVVPVNQLGQELDYCCGLGSVSVGAGADADLTATIRRPVFLGLLCLTPSADAIDITVRSVKVNNIELLNGPAGVNGEVGIEMFSSLATDLDGRIIGYPTRQNDQISITCHNYNVAARTVYGGAFLLPMPLPQR